MKKLLVLCAVVALRIDSIAIAEGISSADDNFLFGNDQIVTATTSDLEIEQTQGQPVFILYLKNELSSKIAKLRLFDRNRNFEKASL